MGSFILWWLLTSLIGLIAWPITWRLFSRFEDRGYGFARIVGLLFTGFLFWLAGSFQLIRINAGGAIISLLLVSVLTFVVLRSQRSEMVAWVRAHRRIVLSTEIVFFIAFAVWAFVRANNPAIASTEKPMELAFLNAILDSNVFPAKDPWLSGYAISYYHFGYVMLAMLTLLSGVAAGVAFNLGNALWFALVAVGTYSLLYNLIARRERGAANPITALLGPLFVLITGNLEAILDVMHARHLFWRVDENGTMLSGFWNWVGLENLELPPLGDPSWIPTRNWWWWRASRVIRDLDLQGNPIDLQSIDEFPSFSFLLADNHPHLLAFPFVLLAVAFALQVFLRSRPQKPYKPFRDVSKQTRNVFLLIAGLGLLYVVPASLSSSAEMLMSIGQSLLSLTADVLFFFILEAALGFLALVLLGYGPNPLSREELIVGGLIFGSLAFLNTWDLPIYLSFFLAVLILVSGGDNLIDVLWSAMTGIFSVLILGVIFFLPWYPTFASQAGGILPHVLHPTRLLHFFIMFGTALVPIAAWLGWKFLNRENRDWMRLIILAIGLPLILFVLMVMLAGLIQIFADPSLLARGFGLMGVNSFGGAVGALIKTRITSSWTAWVLGLIFAAGVLVLRRSWVNNEEAHPDQFVILMILIGALLAIGPEFFYLRDQFGLRMNTIFKFYFAAWILWGLAAAYAVSALWKVRSPGIMLVRISIILPLILGLLYPLLGVWTKTNGFDPPFGRTLNGSMYPSYAPEADREAVEWIDTQLKDGVIAEAVGGSYTYYARVSAHTGLPTVLGWPGHESQWRGGYQEIGDREGDIRMLYTSPDWATTEEIIRRYGIDYVYVGDLERSTYRPFYEEKFETFMDLIYQNEQVRIYAARERSSP
jgi:uncharacterized membrane protein